MKKSDMTLQHRFVSYMILSTLTVMLLSFGLSQWVQGYYSRATIPAETILIGQLEVAAVATTSAIPVLKSAEVLQPSQGVQPSQSSGGASTAQMAGTMVATPAVQSVPAEQIRTIAVQGIDTIKDDLLAISQRQSMVILGLLLLLQFVGSMIWVKYLLVKPVHETVRKIDTLTGGHYDLEPCLDGRHELDHLDHQLFVLSEELRQNKLYRESEAAQRKSLIAGMSHDLKTPLTNICGYAETLMMERDLGQQPRAWLDIIMRNAKMANHLIDDLLDLNRYDLQEYPVYKFKTDVSELLQICVEDFKEMIEGKGQGIQLFKAKGDNPSSDSEASCYFETDRVLMVRLIKNVISNFYQHAGDAARLEIRHGRVGETIFLEFKDNGCGVSKDEVPHLTDIFFIADPSRNKKGSSGLGLYNCQQIVQLLGGELSIESDLGMGLVLTVKLYP